MTLEQILILAIVQGITEFLPISSSAHLVLVPLLSGWQDQGVVFDVALHVGTLFAVMLYFYQRTFALTKGALHVCTGHFTSNEAKLFGLLFLATIPVLMSGYFFKDFVAEGARSFKVLGLTSIIFGILLWVSDLFPRYQHGGLKQITWVHALFFGVMQAFAIIPGTSRSGVTMSAGRFMGFSRRHAAEFSMLMAIPVLMASGLYTIYDSMDAAINWDNAATELGAGILCAFLSALVAIWFLMKLVNHIGFGPFVFYRIMLGTALLTLAA